MLKGVEESWREFSAAIFEGVAVSKVQRVETRRAFYAGAMAMFHSVQRIGEDDIPEQDGIQYLEGVQSELESFLDEFHAANN